MKKILSFISFTLITFFIVSCSASDGPEVAAKAYLDAYNAQDFDKAKEYVTEESYVMIELFKEISLKLGNGKEVAEKEVVNDLKCKIEGDTAAVCSYLNSEKVVKSTNLKKVGGKWLVKLSLESFFESEGVSFPTEIGDEPELDKSANNVEN